MTHLPYFIFDEENLLVAAAAEPHVAALVVGIFGPGASVRIAVGSVHTLVWNEGEEEVRAIKQPEAAAKTIAERMITIASKVPS